MRQHDKPLRNRRLHVSLKKGDESAQLVAMIVGVVDCVE